MLSPLSRAKAFASLSPLFFFLLTSATGEEGSYSTPTAAWGAISEGKRGGVSQKRHKWQETEERATAAEESEGNRKE